MDFVEHMTSELGVSARQAAGGAGLLLAMAQQRLQQDEFMRLADTIPAISDVIGKAPRADASSRHALIERLSRWFGGLGGLAGLATGFQTLGCDKTMIPKFVDSLVSFVRARSGDEVATLLQGVLR